MTKRREFHYLANIFPMLAGDEAKALADDISEHGLREPITLLEGKILDGRNRYIACLDAGIEPRFTHYRGGRPRRLCGFAQPQAPSSGRKPAGDGGEETGEP
jgi:hypothetical protein